MSDISEPRPYMPGIAALYRPLAPYGYPVMRFAAGAVLWVHGWEKLFTGFAAFVAQRVLTPMGFPMPLELAYFLGVLELVGGAMLAFGLLTRPIALMLAVEMAIVTFGWHFKNGYAFAAPGGGYEYPLLLTVLYVGILLRGGGRCSIDRMIGKEF